MMKDNQDKHSIDSLECLCVLSAGTCWVPAVSQLLKVPTGPEKSPLEALQGCLFLLIPFSLILGDSCKGYCSYLPSTHAEG